MQEMQDNQADEPEKVRFWKSKSGKFTIGGLLSVALAAAAGFMSPEVRSFACLELPKPEDLLYPDVNNGTPYRELASQSLQRSFNGKTVRFKIRAYSEFDRTPFQSMLGREFDGYSIASIAAVDERSSAQSVGHDFPGVAILLSPIMAKKWSEFPSGSVIEVEGMAEFLDEFPPDSLVGESKLAMKGRGQNVANISVPAYADFFVVAHRLTPLRALNDPRDRLMCRWRKLDS